MGRLVKNRSKVKSCEGGVEAVVRQEKEIFLLHVINSSILNSLFGNFPSYEPTCSDIDYRFYSGHNLLA